MKKRYIPTVLRFENAIVIEGSNGNRNISDLPGANVHSDFAKYNLNNGLGQTTGQTPVLICRIVKEEKPHKIFTALTYNLNKLVLTQNQIVDLVENYPDQIFPSEFCTLFLIKGANKFYVISAYKYSKLHFFAEEITSKNIGSIFLHRYVAFPELVY